VALAILVLVALAVYVRSSREDLKRDVHLVFLRIERTNGQNVAVFRLDAPKYRNVFLLMTGSMAIVSGTNRISTEPSPDGFLPGHDVHLGGKAVKAGASQEFRLVAGHDDAWRVDAWRLEMELFTESWWFQRGGLASLGTFQSEPITDAMPKSTDTSR
jgi:hypothetical protein